jgi:hypothetical protein
MKAPFLIFALASALTFSAACHREQETQFVIELTQGNGTRENHTLTVGSLMLVHDGEMHVIAKLLSGSDDGIELEVTNYSVTEDTTRREYTVQKTGVNIQQISTTNSALLDPSGNVQINLQSMQKANKDPKGACKGICCEAKCFSVWCCADPDECKNVPCDCKAPPGCLTTHTAIWASQFFELERSGKEVMVFKN